LEDSAGDDQLEISDLKSPILDFKSQVSDLRSQISDLRSLAESCSRQIRAWADSLQDSPIKGQRHLNAQTRQAYASQSRSEAFRAKIECEFREAHPEFFPNADDETRI
jgi:predicted  nucleic acid-binding Zn-ribbon protein